LKLTLMPCSRSRGASRLKSLPSALGVVGPRADVATFLPTLRPVGLVAAGGTTSLEYPIDFVGSVKDADGAIPSLALIRRWA
jgi:hypothetical protein